MEGPGEAGGGRRGLLGLEEQALRGECSGSALVCNGS